MNDRDKNGRFRTGNRASPGRKPRKIERDYLSATLGAVSLRDWKQVVETALQQAIEGDAKARAWLGDFLLGKPAQALDIRGADALLLQQLIALSAERGISAGDLFNAMIAEVAQAEDDEPSPLDEPTQELSDYIKFKEWQKARADEK